MFEHKKQLLHDVKIERPNPQYAVLLQEQLGGGNGELKAAMQYMSQSFRIKDQEIKDLFLDIAAEELSHMEMVATTINLLNGHDVNYKAVDAGEIQSHVILGIDFLLNREEAHNALFREALNKVQNSGSNKDFGVTEDSKLYFYLSTPGPEHQNPNPTPVSFENPRRS